MDKDAIGFMEKIHNLFISRPFPFYQRKKCVTISVRDKKSRPKRDGMTETMQISR